MGSNSDSAKIFFRPKLVWHCKWQWRQLNAVAKRWVDLLLMWVSQFQIPGYGSNQTHPRPLKCYSLKASRGLPGPFMAPLKRPSPPCIECLHDPRYYCSPSRHECATAAWSFNTFLASCPPVRKRRRTHISVLPFSVRRTIKIVLTRATTRITRNAFDPFAHDILLLCLPKNTLCLSCHEIQICLVSLLPLIKRSQ